MIERRVLILGGGLSGLAASEKLKELGIESLLVEKRLRLGGHASSEESHEGYIFDEGPHIFFSQDPDLLKKFDGVLNPIWTDPTISNYADGCWVPHPVQTHLNHLPLPSRIRFLGSILSRAKTPATPADYRDWCYGSFGADFSEHYVRRYTRKYWCSELEELGLDWIGRRVHRPSLREVILGAIGDRSVPAHYLTKFSYPTSGGYQSLVGAFDVGPTSLGTEIAHIDLKRRIATDQVGRTFGFEQLLSTVPLPEFVDICEDVPPDVLEAASRLRCTSVLTIDISLTRRPRVEPGHWFYVYDDDIPFSRASLPHLISASTVPAACGSIQLEIYREGEKPSVSEIDELVQSSLEACLRMGLMAPEDVRGVSSRYIRWANVIFDHQRAASLEVVLTWLAEVGVTGAGRFGLWEYLWTDGAIRSGWSAAETVAQDLGSMRDCSRRED